jgi:hypothetical protein
MLPVGSGGRDAAHGFALVDGHENGCKRRSVEQAVQHEDVGVGVGDRSVDAPAVGAPANRAHDDDRALAEVGDGTHRPPSVGISQRLAVWPSTSGGASQRPRAS